MKNNQPRDENNWTGITARKKPDSTGSDSRLAILEEYDVQEDDFPEFDDPYVRGFHKYREEDVGERAFRLTRTVFQQYIDVIDNRATKATHRDVERYGRWLEGNRCAQSTINNYLAPIKKFHKFLNRGYRFNLPDVDDIKGSKFRDAPSPRERKPLPREDVKRLFDATSSLRESLVIGLLYYGGLRRKKVTTLKLKHVDLENRRFKVVNAKMDGDRTLPIGDSLKYLLQIWLESERVGYAPASTSDYLIVGKESATQIHPQDVYEMVREVADAAGIQEVVGRKADGGKIYRVKPHVLRHSIATHLAEDAIPLDHIQRFLGHKNLDTTLTYASQGVEAAAEAYLTDYTGL
ncbi:tyrosine-type recombinase/integrase [Halobacteriaceae archaeon GCM10025711]